MRLAVADLVVHLKGRPVLERIDCVAEPGQVTAIIGPNGAGKTTLLRTMAGLLRPRSGSVVLGGRPLEAWDAREQARALAFLPQDRTVHWDLAARAVVALGRLPHRPLGAGESAADRAAIDAALLAADATHLASRPVLEMSGGERARVLMARVLAQQPSVLLADEPAAGLDPAHQLSLFGHFARLAGKGRTVVVALHDLSLAARFCHRIVLVRGGRIAAAGAPQDVLTAPILADVYRIDARYETLDGVPVVLPRRLLP